MRTQSPAPPVWTRAGIAAACTAGIILLAWHGDTIRLSAGGNAVVWPVLVGFGLAWTGRSSALWRSGAGMAAGSAAGVAAVVLAAKWLPLTPAGSAIGLGVGVAVVALAVFAMRGALSLGASVAAFGVGAAVAQTTGFDVTTGAAQAVEVWTAGILALLLGLVGAEAAAGIAGRTTVARSEPLPDVSVITERIPAARAESRRVS